METTIYRVEVKPLIIHVLGNGPYSLEVADQFQISRTSKFVFVSPGEDQEISPDKLIVGIANPAIKKRVIEQFYDELEDDIFISVLSTMISVSGVSWEHIASNRAITIGPFTSIGHDTEIGDFVSILSNATIGHDCTIGKYSTICPGAIISGNVAIGEATFIGAGAVIKEGISIGHNVLVGCGAVVVQDVEDNRIVTGNPAKFLKV